MSGERGLVWCAAPSWRIRYDEVTVDELGHAGEEVAVPRESINIDFHDLEVGYCGGPMQVHERRQVAIEVVRRRVDLMRVGQCRDPEGLPHAVPDAVDDRDVDRLGGEIRRERSCSNQGFATADSMLALLS